MELIWCYIDGYSCLKRREFKFNTEFKISFFRRHNLLVVCPKKSLPDNFFSVTTWGGQTVVNVSAVVGANGTGKTSLAAFLCDIKTGRGIDGEYVLLFRRMDGSLVLYYHCDEKRVIRGYLFGANGLRKIDRHFVRAGEMLSADAEFEKDYYLYYSPYFTTERVVQAEMSYKCGGNVTHDPRHVFDWSTTGLLHSILKHLKGSDFPGRSLDVMGSYNLQEKRRVAIFIAKLAHVKDIQCRSLEIVRHLKLQIGIERPRSQFSDCDCVDPLVAFVKTYYERLKELDDGDEKSELYPLIKDIGCRIEKGDVEVSRRFSGDLSDYFLNHKSTFVYSVVKHFAQACHVIALFGKFWMVAEKDGHGFGAEPLCGWLSVPLDMDEDDLVPIYELLGHFRTDRYLEACFRLDFSPRMSSGEMAFLSMWGRLFETFYELEHYPDIQRRPPWFWEEKVNDYAVTLFVDEGETTLHPLMQRELVWRTIWFLELVAPHAKVHVIFASHSPVLLSDIPCGGVTFLTEQKSIRKMDCNSPANTFGGNIFDLFYQSFFMKEGMVGKFAMEKINKMMAEVNAGRAVDNYLLALIGDEFLKKYFESKQKHQFVEG